MCVYETTEIINAVANVVSAVVQVQEARVEKAQYEYQTELYTSQAKKIENRATSELQDGIEKARRQRLNAILDGAEQTTTIAAGNLGVTSQTSLNIIDDEKLNGELDALTTLKTAEQKYATYIDKANEYYENAELSASKAKYAYIDNTFEYFKTGTKDKISTIYHLFKKGTKK